MSMIGCTKFRFTGRPRELCWPSVETDVFEMQGLVVDAAERRRNPVRKLSRLGHPAAHQRLHEGVVLRTWQPLDRKSTRLNSSHVEISYAVFCLKKKTRT